MVHSEELDPVMSGGPSKLLSLKGAFIPIASVTSGVSFEAG